MIGFMQFIQSIGFIGDGGGTPIPPEPLPAIDYLLIVGSSTMVETFSLNTVRGRQEQVARTAQASAGIDIPIINRAVGGQTIGQLDSAIAGYLTDMGAPAKTVGVLISIGSNNIGQTAYGSMLEATRDAMESGLNSIITKVVNAGFVPILTTIQSRPTFEDMYEEWADLMYRPLCGERSPDWYVGPLAVMDFCRLYRDNKDVVDWWQEDDVHPDEATPATQIYVADQLATYATIKPMPAPDRYLFSWRTATAYYLGGVNTVVGAASGTFSEVYNDKGQLDAAASLSWSDATGNSGGARGNAGVWDIDLTNHRIQSANLYRSGGTINFTANFGAGRASATGIAKFAANSSTASRVTRFTIGAETGTVNASTGIDILELPFTLDGAGSITFTAAPEAPATFANTSGVEFVFD
jgi:hypothetical protein